jgi:hypothetical protein
MGIPLHLPNQERPAPSSVHRVVEGIVTLTILVRLVVQGVRLEAGVEVRHLNGKSQDHLVHLEVEVQLLNVRREGRRVVRKNGRNLRLQPRRNVEAGLLVRGRGRMLVLDLVDGRVTESRRRGGPPGQSLECYVDLG